jgi:hypothetical protein
MKRLLFLAAFLPAAAHAAWGDFEYNYDLDTPWKELETQLPPYPKEEDLLPFTLGPTTDNSFFIDQKSISVGEDGIIRFTLVIRSPQGANNVMFEGIRCATEEARIYAYGRADGTWSKAKDNVWRTVLYDRKHRPEYVLTTDFFCPRNIVVANPREAIEALKQGKNPHAGKSTWF